MPHTASRSTVQKGGVITTVRATTSGWSIALRAAAARLCDGPDPHGIILSKPNVCPQPAQQTWRASIRRRQLRYFWCVVRKLAHELSRYAIPMASCREMPPDACDVIGKPHEPHGS